MIADATETRWSIWAHFPLALRRGTSDADVYAQVYEGREYAILDGLDAPDLVIDCGAYTGLSAAYFLSRWPACRLIALEPDPDNFRLCEFNLAPYGDRAEVLFGAVWSDDQGVRRSDVRYRDGREWSRMVRAATDRFPPQIGSVNLGRHVPRPGRTLVKMDIEGAEAVVFAAPDLSWLDRVAALVIETHDDSAFGPCSQRIARVMADRGFAASKYGELTLFRK